MSQKLKVAELIPHEKNDYFFDDIKGDAWTEFVESVKTSGVIEPIVVTQEKVIVSGHQRVRACKLLGIDEIDAEVRIIETDDEVLKQLIETNIRQRGIGNTNPVKFGRCIKELERIYGIKEGRPEKLPQNAEVSNTTQEDLASQLGISVDTLSRYKQLADMIPEIQDLVETGIVTPTTARAIVKKLPEDQQKALAEQFKEKNEKVTGKEVNDEIEKLKASLQDMKEERDYLQFQLEEEQSKEPETVEVVPEDYSSNAEQLELLKQQMIVNAKIELADFVKKYMDYVDVKALIKRTLETL